MKRPSWRRDTPASVPTQTDPSRAAISAVMKLPGRPSAALPEDGEVGAVEAGQALVGANPQGAVGRLRDGADRVLRQPLLLGPAAMAELAQLLGGIERRGREGRGECDQCHGSAQTDPARHTHTPDTTPDPSVV